MSNTNKSVGPLWHEPVLVPIIFTARFRLPGIPTVLDIHSTYSTSDFPNSGILVLDGEAAEEAEGC
jgi:hypothetical protein